MISLAGLAQFLAPRAQAVLAALNFWFYVACLLLVLLLAFRREERFRPRRRTLHSFAGLFLAAFGAILAYQATWQLAGFTRRDFVRFMERHNPREDNAAAHLVRGEIRDRAGRILAESDPTSKSLRAYPYGPATAHVIGFRHPTEGLTGLENAADMIVSGYAEPGERDFRKTGLTAMKDVRHVGGDIVLTLDADLQQHAYALMDDRRGAVVALDPRNGAIRILLSSPAFDPNAFDRALNRDPDSPLLNRALHGRYPAGSTFKIAIAGLAVERGIPLHIDCPANGYLAPGARRPIRDHEYYAYEKRGLVWPGFGVLDLDTALAKSSNTYFANAAVRCGTDAFNDLADRLWFNARIPVFQTAGGALVSQKGNLPHLGRGERRELAQLGIGQGRLTATPLHMAMLVAAIANDGRMFQPRLVEAEPPQELPRLFRASTARRVAQAMRRVVTHGTGRAADLPGLDVCGKTGTAQNPGGEDHAWFVCFAPRRNPRLAVAVIVENAGYGSASALPIAASILERAAALEARYEKETP
ncbi:MAG: peptidoglycan D,D-transpeptidase FtsI family protein [Kiritimatiellia bacterium]|jgi:peptidoglycan glycosyltransferase